MVETTLDPKEHVVTVKVRGKLTRPDYDAFVPKVEALIKEWKTLNVLFVMNDFHGWNMGALWEDLMFDLRHFRDIERVAMVGEKRWQKGMSAFCRPFTTAAIKYFDQSDVSSADEWVRGESGGQGDERDDGGAGEKEETHSV